MAAPSSSATDLPKHPAKYSNTIMPVVADLLDAHFWGQTGPFTILDPFGGVGGIHELRMSPNGAQYLTFASELEWKWALQAGDLDPAIQADALHLPIRDRGVHAVVTSPCYGNRMADKHFARDACSTCIGNGCTSVRAETKCCFTSEFEIRNRPDLKGATHRQHMAGCSNCKKCGGSGLSKRNTYTHQYGEPLREESAATMQWGTMYRNFHHEAWQEVWRVLGNGELFICNVSNHIRKGEEVDVVGWHQGCILGLGFEMVRDVHVPTPRNGMGSNGKIRVEHEHVTAYRKPG